VRWCLLLAMIFIGATAASEAHARMEMEIRNLRTIESCVGMERGAYVHHWVCLMKRNDNASHT